MRKAVVLMSYFLSNYPPICEMVLTSCGPNLEMVEELNRLITHPFVIAEFGRQIQSMNLVHAPSRESVVEFRTRV